MEMSIKELGLKGKHNLYNSMAAGMTSSLLKLRKKKIKNSLKNFENLEHRLESVLKIGGVEFINDSKATNINSVWYALETAKRPIVWIAGGVDKGNDYNLIKDLVKQKVKMIATIGEDVQKLNETFGDVVERIINFNTLEEAVTAAYGNASRGEVVLFSPACASFDMFENYMERGEQFKDIVRNL